MKYLSSVIIALSKTSRLGFLVLPFFILGDNFFLKGIPHFTHSYKSENQRLTFRVTHAVSIRRESWARCRLEGTAITGTWPSCVQLRDYQGRLSDSTHPDLHTLPWVICKTVYNAFQLHSFNCMKSLLNMVSNINLVERELSFCFT